MVHVETIKCPDCGGAIDRTMKFCPYCGAKIVVLYDDSEVMKMIIEHDREMKILEMEQERQEYERKKTEEKDARERKIFLIQVIAVLTCLIGGTIFLLLMEYNWIFGVVAFGMIFVGIAYGIYVMATRKR